MSNILILLFLILIRAQLCYALTDNNVQISLSMSCVFLHMQNKGTDQLCGNALVICNHGPPTPGEGRGIAVEMSGVFTFALSPQCGGNTRDLCYIGKKGGAMKT